MIQMMFQAMTAIPAFFGDENMSCWVFGSLIVAFGQLGGMKANGLVEMRKFV